jgi:hypothetical protein
MPMIPIFIIFLIGALAETNRSPMDLAEAAIKLDSASIKVIYAGKPLYRTTSRNIFKNSSETKHNHFDLKKLSII